MLARCLLCDQSAEQKNHVLVHEGKYRRLQLTCDHTMPAGSSVLDTSRYSTDNVASYNQQSVTPSTQRAGALLSILRAGSSSIDDLVLHMYAYKTVPAI